MMCFSCSGTMQADLWRVSDVDGRMRVRCEASSSWVRVSDVSVAFEVRVL